jgi:uncharacterized protein (TIGR03435 family)
VTAGVKIDGAQVHARFLALKDYIQSAYKVKNYQVVGPDWLGAERFEIDAKLPAGARPNPCAVLILPLGCISATLIGAAGKNVNWWNGDDTAG